MDVITVIRRNVETKNKAILNSETEFTRLKGHCHGLTCAETFTLEDSRGHVFLSAAIMESSVSV